MGNPKTRECAYCGQVTQISRDHVIPECLFRRPYPPNLITVPACVPCNGDKSDNDDFLRDLLTMDVYGHQSPTARAIFREKVLSSARQHSSDVAEIAVKESRIEPFHTREGVYLAHMVSAPLDEGRKMTVFSTIIRGLEYYESETRIPADYCFSTLTTELRAKRA